jgi:hypothetical protein
MRLRIECRKSKHALNKENTDQKLEFQVRN